MKIKPLDLTISKRIQQEIEMQKFFKNKLRESYKGLDLSNKL